MLVFVLLLGALLLSSMTVAKKNEFYSDYCSHKNTAAINGIFSILIFLSHAVTYVNLTGALDGPYFTFRKFLGQLVVVTYLFFSGYGIMVSIKKKGLPYVKAMPFNRFFKLWYHFAIVIVLFSITSILIIGRRYELKDYLLSYIGYTTIGNSNWYMFVTFAMYIIVIVSFLVFRKHRGLSLASVCVLAFLFAWWEKEKGLGTQYYNTVICFPLGMIFAEIKPYLDKICMKNDLLWFTAFSGSVLVFAYFSQNRGHSLTYYELFVTFALAVLVLFMMKVNIENSILDWFGKHIFSFFILQRIPMLLLRHFGFAKQGYFFIIVSFFGTVFLAVIFDELVGKLDSLIFKKKKPVENKNVQIEKGV